MKEQPVDRVEVLGNILDQHDMAGEIRHELGAAQHRQCIQVEGDRGICAQRGL
jgi:hypothetical protein